MRTFRITVTYDRIIDLTTDSLDKKLFNDFLSRVDDFSCNEENQGKILEENYKNDLAIRFIYVIAQKIYENKVKKTDEEIRKALDFVEKTREKNIKLFKNRKYETTIINKIIEDCMKNLQAYLSRTELEKQCMLVFNKELEEIPQNPESFIKSAYKESFQYKNLENIMKFVLKKFLMSCLLKYRKQSSINWRNLFYEFLF